MFKIAIIGRENVGKSTIFNKLCQKDFSIVSNIPGVTRDYIKQIGKLFDLEFELIDTAGWYLGKNKKDINIQIKQNTLSTIDEVNLIFFVVDVKTALSEEDLIFARKVRKFKKKIVLLANKSESKKLLTQKKILRLGLGEAVFISAEHKLGFDNLYDKISSNFEKKSEYIEAQAEELEEEISISIIGRPNVGKSTLFNAILGFERSLVSEIAGTTRDFVVYKVRILDTIINLIDTAGVRRRSKVHEEIEELSVTKTILAIRTSDIVLLVMDPKFALEKQDLILANLALKYKKLLILIINKEDLIDNFTKLEDEINYLTKKRLPQIKDVSVIYTSVKNKFNAKILFRKIIDLWKLYQTKIPTSKLNNWLSQTLATYGLPIFRNNIKLKVKYVKQNAVYPSIFYFFINISGKISVNQNFEKFLINSLRKKFRLHGMPIEVKFISSKNPFV